ncbi:MAG: single-stranded-DNA-specific exonuclease RecJ, partial [Lentisphaeraceae bacterium]|nr:single-stranded-DNA-specific exonuclease RecJ [Lentisphaeraceae bacterium]
EVDDAVFASYSKVFGGLSRSIIRSLIIRGIAIDDVDGFLRAPLDSLTDPFRLPDMEIAVERIWKAIENKEKIFVHGDYDTDGVTSAVLIEWVLAAYGADIEVFVSNRMEDGYGPTESTIAKLAARGANVIISSDCGITSFAACVKAKELGIDFIITDHHNPGSELPEAFAIVNPRLKMALVDLHGLAGVGVAFKLCHGFVKSSLARTGCPPDIDLRVGLDLVAMGTVADVSPLTGENRSLVKNGLKLLAMQGRPGLLALSEMAYMEGRVTTSDISRRLAPKINAAGRVGDPMVSVDLLRSKESVTASKLAYLLEKFNRKRRQAERQAYREALELARFELSLNSMGGLVIVGNGWHPGVIGLLATKVSKHYNRPVIVLCKDSESGELLGSGRSCAQLDILNVLNNHAHLLSSFGGHPMAVGISLSEDNLDEFKIGFVEAFYGMDFNTPTSEERLFADDEMMFCELSDSFIDQLEMLEPFGVGNSEPIYFYRKARVVEVCQLGERHCRGILEDDSGINVSFVCYSISQSQFPSGDISIMASPRRVTIKGCVEIQLFIVDVKSYENS